MRVAILTNFVAPYRVPLFEFLARHLEELVVLVSTPMEKDRMWGPVESEMFAIQATTTITLKRQRRGPGGFPETYELHLPIGAHTHLRRVKPDVVISGELGLRSLLATTYCRTRGIPLIIWATLSEHTESIRGRLRVWFRRHLVRHADHVFVNGQSGARYIQSLGVSGSYITEIGQPSDLTNRKITIGREPRSLDRMLYVGSLIPRKGLTEFISAITTVAVENPNRSIQFRIAGEGSEAEALRRIHHPKNLHIEFLGHLNDAQLCEEYANSGLLVFPTLSDEWGLVVNEAMSMGIPVLGSTYSQAVEELIENGVTGWTFDPLDADGTQQVLRNILETPAEIAMQLGVRARKAVERYTVEAVGNRMLNALCTARRK